MLWQKEIGQVSKPQMIFFNTMINIETKTGFLKSVHFTNIKEKKTATNVPSKIVVKTEVVQFDIYCYSFCS